MWRKINLKMLLVGIILFFFFTFLMFPYQYLIQTVSKVVYKQTRIQLQAESMYPNVFGWPGVTFRSPEIFVRQAGLVLSAKSMTTRIGFCGFFSRQYQIAFGDLVPEGDLKVSYCDQSPSFKAKTQLDELDLEFLKLYGNPSQVSGKVEGGGALKGNQQNLKTLDGVMKLLSSDFAIEGMNIQNFIKIPKLFFGLLNIHLVAEEGVLHIKTFIMGKTNSDVVIELTGKLLLGKSIQDSTLNVIARLKLNPEFAADPRSRDFKSFLTTYETEPYQYAMKWNAKIGEMQTNILSALPKKL